jgi:DNA-binding response OmpR family regulator
MKVLLVDDDTDLLDVTAYALRREGMDVVLATDGERALERWQADRPDVIVLDLRLHEMSGLEVCRTIRQRSNTPIILITGLTAEASVAEGFHAGADDYLRKPFSPRELVMRIRAVWRRVADVGAQLEPPAEVRVGDLRLDVESQQVLRRGRAIRLTRTEFRLLHILAMNAGRVVPGHRLVEYAWGYREQEVSLLRAHISHLRTKLNLRPGGPGQIVAIPGVGYTLTLPDAPVGADTGCTVPQ